MLEDIQKLIYKKIPISKKMGIKIKNYNGKKLELSSPLELNKNHKLTAFGGSIYSLMVLTGWIMIYIKLKENNLKGTIVIKDSQIDFIKPVSDDLHSIVEINDEEKINLFLNRFKRRGIARIKLVIKINKGNQDFVIMNGEYVITK